MAGGQGNRLNDFQSDHTSEHVDSNGASLVVPHLPLDFWEHCVTKFNATYNIIVGGAKTPKRTMLVNSKTFQSTIGEDLTGSGRQNHTCSHIRHNNGSNYVIAAGGFDVHDQVIDTSEILKRVGDASIEWSLGKQTNKIHV